MKAEIDDLDLAAIMIEIGGKQGDQLPDNYYLKRKGRKPMCYTGSCKYETYQGECSLGILKDYPEDAACEQAIREMDKEWEKHMSEDEE